MPKRKSNSNVEGKDGVASEKRAKKVREPAKKAALNAEVPSKLLAPDELFIKTTTRDGRQANLKIASWNVAGLRACVQKNFVGYIKKEDADIVCLQETKCAEKDVPGEVKALSVAGATFHPGQAGYHMFWSAAEQKGYSGVSLWSKIKPEKVTYGMGVEEHDKEGRLITAEFDKFFAVTSYVPNAGRGLVRLAERQKWDCALLSYLNELNCRKPVVFCGDLNVAHQEHDLANPKGNRRNAGFTQEERDGFTALLAAGYIDSFRLLNPDAIGAYTFWTYTGNARAKNVGWRLDYFVLSKALESNLCDSVIRSSVLGSDHCPVVLTVSL